MSLRIFGNTKGLAASELKALEKITHRRIGQDEIVSLEVAREICSLAEKLRRRLGVLIDRKGQIEWLVIGTKEILYLPDLGRYRLSRARLRNLRLVFSDLSRTGSVPVIPYDIYGDLEKLRLDCVASLRQDSNRVGISYAYLVPLHESETAGSKTENARDLGLLDLDFDDFIENLELELASEVRQLEKGDEPGALLVGVYDPKDLRDPASSMLELRELARTAGLRVLETVVQKRRTDPKTFIGKGKLEEVVLRCLRRGAEMIVFDAELKPAQWRTVVNQTELKVIDRSMLILDIFSRRASSSEGRLQVELAQLKYNLPRLTEQDSGLSRLSGGIGGRGPGETKLEVGRRRVRERLALLEAELKKVKEARGIRRLEKERRGMRVVSIIGYTNVGKSTIFNAVTGAGVLAENKLFATLDPSQRKVFLPHARPNAPENEKYIVLSDTVGFIRDLPKELEVAFRATLEELYHAAFLVHVIDASDPDALSKYAAVREILKSMELDAIPEIVVANKIDNQRLSDESLAEIHAIPVSAVKGVGLKDLLAEIERQFQASSSLPQATRLQC